MECIEYRNGQFRVQKMDFSVEQKMDISTKRKISAIPVFVKKQVVPKMDM